MFRSAKDHLMATAEDTKNPIPTPVTPLHLRYLPLGVSLSGVRCVVVGGGSVGARKALSLVEAGASVHVVSPAVCDRLALAAEDGRVRWTISVYRSSFLDGASLVVAATSDPALNVRIGAEAEARGVLYCVASSARHSRVIFPAVHADDAVTIAVHTNGRDCRLSRRTRDDVAGWLRERRRPRHRLLVCGVYREEVGADGGSRLARAGEADLREAFPDHEVLTLGTCRRWECYLFHPSHCVSRAAGRAVLDQALGDADRGRGFVQAGAGARRHLLRVAAGLDSNLVGETDVVAQIRDALRASPLDESCGLGAVFRHALTAQKRVRAESGLAESPVSWSEAVADRLERELGSLAGRCVAVVGCGGLGRRIAVRLRSSPCEVLAVSRRAGRETIARDRLVGDSADRRFGESSRRRPHENRTKSVSGTLLSLNKGS